MQNEMTLPCGPGIRRESAGCYTVYFSNIKATVIRNRELAGANKWIAYAQWDQYTVTDPVATKAEAVACAAEWIAQRYAALKGGAK